MSEEEAVQPEEPVTFDEDAHDDAEPDFEAEEVDEEDDA